MMRLVTAAQMRGLEARVAARGTELRWLMESAGRAVAEAVCRRGSKKPLFLIGPGQNGGDGLVAARHLLAAGVEPRVMVVGGGPTKGDGAGAREAFLAAPGAICVDAAADAFADCDLIIDALLGIGQHLPLRGAIKDACVMAGASGKPVLAVDVPTGVDANSGAVDASALRADETITFGYAKCGLFLYPGAEAAGDVRVDAVGLVGCPDGPLCATFSECDAALPPRRPDSHKKQHGSLLVVAGSPGLAGAAFLCGKGAQALGAGLIRLALPESIEARATSLLPEATTQSLAGAELPDFSRIDAVAIGPGIGKSADAALRLRAVLDWSGPAVLDADALTLVSAYGGLPRRGPTVLTPHVGEFARLMGEPFDERRRIDMARAAAARFGAVVLLKGRPTVVAAPQGNLYVITVGGPILAAGGSGDVLTGLIGTLLAQGVAPLQAAATAAYVHGRAADLLARQYGVDRGLAASELMHGIREVLKTLVPA